MKRSYTQMRTFLGWCAKRSGETPEKLLNIAEIKAREELNAGTPTAESLVLAAALCIDHSVITGDAVHLFLPGREFCDWIVSCVSKPDRRHAEIIDQIATGKAAVIHFPTGAGLISFACLCPRKTIDPLTGKSDAHNLLLICKSTDDGQIKNQAWVDYSGGCPRYESVEIGHELKPDCHPDTAYRTKLVVGLGMYVECFPETLVHGFPEDIKHPSHHQHSAPLTIAVTEKVRQSLGGTHESPMPHFRAGHFRVLKSEKFTNKRFHVVFVRETFVKGRAETVLAPEEVPM